MARWLVVGAFVWPLLLGSALWTRARGAGPLWTAIVYATASGICHQRPERSFFTAGVQWPVCGRCSGLYLAAPVGALAAMARRRRRDAIEPLPFVALAGAPTIVTIALEWLRLFPVTTPARTLAALPLGAALAYVIVRAVEKKD